MSTAYLYSMPSTRSILFIQTAFIGDAILASAMWETWHQAYPHDQIDVCVRKGNESLFIDHPFIRHVHIWDKGGGIVRYNRLIALAKNLRSLNYDVVVTPHRHASSGLLSRISRAPKRMGFGSHPLHWLFTKVVAHEFREDWHEVDRNHQLIKEEVGFERSVMPRLYPKNSGPKTPSGVFGVMAPASQWFTKQWPENKWIALCDSLEETEAIVLLGGKQDAEILSRIQQGTRHPNVITIPDLALSESLALMSQAAWVVTNDSGPMHMASALNIPTVAIFCSTSPKFGFGPLSAKNAVIEAKVNLSCKPCGLHGHKACPERHFNCAQLIEVSAVSEALSGLA